jgi:hypothetical protein
MTIMGDLGGILATWLLGVLSLAPCQYFLASEVTVVLSVLMLVLFISNTVFLCDQNRKFVVQNLLTSRKQTLVIGL